LLYTCLSESSSDELMLCNSHVKTTLCEGLCIM